MNTTAKVLPCRSLLREHLEFRDGVFYWLKPFKHSRMQPGDLWGCLNKLGYWQGRFNGTIYQRSRLVWMYCTGDDPGADDIDHENWVTTDDRFKNLRRLSTADNSRHRKRAKRIYFEPGAKEGWTGAWRAGIKFNGVHYRSSRYSTEEEARNWLSQYIDV